jgi:hypothetical protein
LTQGWRSGKPEPPVLLGVIERRGTVGEQIDAADTAGPDSLTVRYGPPASREPKQR